jgi:hypothetical protein
MKGCNDREQRRSRCWRRHALGPKDGSERSTVVNYFARLEYQDGKRKRQHYRKQAYHGRGTVHVHCLVWLENVEAARLGETVSATVPSDNERLKTVVLASQQSWSGSGWPVRDDESAWDAGAKLLRLHHTAEDHRRGIRAYLSDVLGALKCHMDVVASDGRGMILRYVAGYVPKFSDSFAQEWLTDDASGYAIARRVLRDYHPLEPEMWLQTAAHLFPQCFAGGTMMPFLVPVPWEAAEPPSIVQSYMACAWRSESMCLLDFLRRTNGAGHIHAYLKRRYKTEGVEGPLEAWANVAPLRGEKMVAALYLSRFSDRFYGQWLLMNVPFRSMDDLWRDEASLVPTEYRLFALALQHRPDYWRPLLRDRF